jgi:hypothetical protein
LNTKKGETDWFLPFGFGGKLQFIGEFENAKFKMQNAK